jgi:adenylate kinase
MAEQKQAVVIGGCPGSGKSSIINRIQSLRRATAVETGRLLREQKEKKTPLGEKLRPSLEKGDLAPTELVNRVVEEAVRSAGDSLILFDGYPRNREEIQHLQEMEEKELFEQAAIIVLHLTRETAVKRISGRRKCENCGFIRGTLGWIQIKTHDCDCLIRRSRSRTLLPPSLSFRLRSRIRF